MREAPLEFAVGEAHADEVAYGQCESVEPEEGADYQIDCGMPWVEVAWYYVSSVSAEEAHQAGFTQLRMTFSTERLLRASIHRILPSGDTQKLASNTLLTDGDSIAAPLDEPGGYFIYVARGRSMWPVWDTGSIAFEVTPSFE